MKRLCLFNCVLCLLLCGCSDTSTNNSVEETISTSSIAETVEETLLEPVTINTSDYETILFKDLPDSFDGQSSKSGKVCITGFLTDEISYDGSAGFLSNSGQGSMTAETVYGKYTVLDLSSVTITGGQYVMVFGELLTEDYYDVYNNHSLWHIKVDAIQPASEIPDGVKQYDEFVESYHFKALAEVINFIGNCTYSWYNGDEATIDKVDCDYSTMLNDTMTDYNLVYTTIGEELRTIGTIYNEVLDYVDKEETPEDVEEYYNSFIECYDSLTQNLEIVGLFE